MTSILQNLNEGLIRSMESDGRVFLLGEDLLDPYGGAFKVTRGISTRFPDKVLTTPISEPALIGIATGMAMRGLRPVVEIMFGDFMTLAMDQILNHASKFRWVYNENVSVPIVVRTPMGGRRGYGPTHSQSLEKLFLGIPGVRVIALNTISDPAKLIGEAISDNDPVILIEHKLLYACQLLVGGRGDLVDLKIEKYGDTYPTHKIGYSSKPQITIATYGYNFEIVRKVVLEILYEREIFSEIILFSQLSPFNLTPLLDSIAKTKRLLTVEEGTLSLGWGSEIVSRVSENGLINARIKRVGALDYPIANSKTLEDKILPSHQVIKQAINDLLE
ncbi:MAG: transketolase C-terminal domain-containing protein [Chloroflexota bacterium]